MTTKTLSGTYPNGYSVANTVESVRVTATGVVNGVGLSATGGLTLTNSGSIVSAANGSFGVTLKDVSRVTNDNLISGGAGAPGRSAALVYYGGSTEYLSFPAQTGQTGGVGVDLIGGGRLLNSGVIDGGAGGQGGGSNYVPTHDYPDDGPAGGGAGGAGVSLAATGSVLKNTGTIQGGAGGAGGYDSNAHERGAPGAAGAGVVLSAGGRVVNGDRRHAGALISGGVGVSAIYSAPVTVTNFGTIQGSVASVQFSSSADRLIAMPGADFIGGVEGGSGTLELDGGMGSISGIGVGDAGGVLSGVDHGAVSDFGTYEFAAGGHWTVAGVGLAFSQQVRTAGDLSITGDVTLARSIDRLDETKSGVVRVGPGVTVTNAGVIQAGGTGGIVIQDGVDNTGKLIAKGGDLTVTGAVTGDGSATVESGVLRLDGAFTQSVAFAGADPSGTLALKKATAYDGQVVGFSTDGQTQLDLLDVGFTSANEASFSGTSTGGVLTVSDGTNIAKIKLKGDYVGDTFTAKSDGSGGVIVTASDPGAAAGAAQLVQAIASFGAGADPPSAFQARFELAQTDPLIAPSVLRTLSNGAARS